MAPEGLQPLREEFMRTPTSALRWALSVFCVAAVSMIPASLSAADARQGPSPEPAKGLSLEERADIFMARKMYREAVDIYTQ